MSRPLVIVDLDLTLYSLGEFLRVHRHAPVAWANALCRLSPDGCDRAIDAVWRSVQPHIAERIGRLEGVAAEAGREVLWLTAYPLTATKLATFSGEQRTASSFPHSKIAWARASALTRAEAVIGDRASDARLARHLGAAHAGYAVWHPAQRLTDTDYTAALMALWHDGLQQARQPTTVPPSRSTEVQP